MELALEKQYEESFVRYLESKDYHQASVWVEHSPIEGGLIIKAQIDWGDWKHDHLYYGCLLEEWAKENGLTILSPDFVEEVTEEDGSDCYSGRHHCGLYKWA